MIKQVLNRYRHQVLVWIFALVLAAASGCSHGGDAPAAQDPVDNHPQGVDWQDIVAGNKGKICIITARYTDGAISRGEGFFLKNHIVVTTYDRVRVSEGAASLYDIGITLPDGEELGVLGMDISLENRNIAFLQVAPQAVAPVSPGEFDSVSASDDIIHIGMPQPPAWTENSGSVIATGTVADAAEPDWMDPDTRVIQHDASCDPDSNGGMILSAAGEAVAILFAGSDGGSEFCLGISIDYVTSKAEDLSFSTIDDIILSGCTENILEGDFVISGFDDLSGLDALSTVTSVTGNIEILYLQDLEFDRLEGFECLQTVGGSLVIADNDIFTNITAFQNLTSVGGDLVIGSHHRLTDFIGLKNLRSVGGDMIIGGDDAQRGNDVLTFMGPFVSLATIGGSLVVKNNHMLPALDRFGNPYLTAVGGDLVIENNDMIVNLQALDDLASIDGNMVIKDNDALTSLENLNALEFVGGNLIIGSDEADESSNDRKGNGALTDLGLNALSAVGGDFRIVDNYELCTDLAESLVDQVGEENIGGIVKISHNSRDCSP